MGAHVAHLDVSHRADATAFLDHVTKQLIQNPARLLIGHREQALAQRTPGHIGIAPLTRHKRSIVPFDTQALGLQTSRQVRQCTRVDQLAQDRRSRLGEATDQVDQTRAVEAHTREIRIVHEVHHLPLASVIFLPVVSDRQNRARTFVDGNDVGSSYPVLIIVGRGQVDIDVHLKDCTSVIVVRRRVFARHLVIFLFNIRDILLRCGQLHIAVEAYNLQREDLVLGLLHHVRVARRGLQVRRTVGHDEVFGGHEHRHRTLKDRIVVDFLERRASQRQAKQHLFKLVPILRHFFGDDVVELILYALGLLGFLRRQLPGNFCTYRARRGVELAHSLCLEPHHGLGQHGVEHTRRTFPRLRAVLDAHTQQVQTLDIGHGPVSAAVAVGSEGLQQVGCDGLQLVLVHALGKVVTKLFRKVFLVLPVTEIDRDLPSLCINLNARRLVLRGDHNFEVNTRIFEFDIRRRHRLHDCHSVPLQSLQVL